uniref:LytR/AlgR family response regulator transcription factor n=1 Tax=Roseivirga sp. TaxID=1964215 RepID=UPI0040485BEF
MMKVVIVEDEILSAKRLAKIVMELEADVEVLAILESVLEAKKWFETNPKPDLIFLDIQLNDGTGFDIIQGLKDYPRIIFTTAYEEYSLEAFKYNSIDYLLKPIDPIELTSTFEKLKRINHKDENGYRDQIEAFKANFNATYRERFLIKVGNQFKSISIKEVSYFYYTEGLTYIQTNAQSLPMDFTLDQLMEQLDPKQFFRINRQCIVKISSIKEIHAYFNSRLLLNLSPSFPQEVVVSRERVQAFKVWAGM